MQSALYFPTKEISKIKLMAQRNNNNHGNPPETLASPSLTSPSSPRSPSSSSPTLIKTSINAGHYQKLLEDDVSAFGDQVPDFSELVRVSDNSSILHIAASTGNSERMVEFIVEKCPLLLRRPNSKGDLPVHVAVRAGHLDVVRKLVNLADQVENYSGNLMLKQENSEKNTALHIALENQQEKMAEYLFDKCPQTYFVLNDQKISPLFLGIKAGFWVLVAKMVERGDEFCSGIDKDELLKYSAVHAAIMSKNEEILEKILRQYPDEVLYAMDEDGRRPLSYAAYIGFLDGVKCILNMKDDDGRKCLRNQAFKADNDGSFPVHNACRGGHIHVVKEMLFTLPDNMRWLLNQKGQCILHVAAESGNIEVVRYLLRQPKLVTMINMKDEDGYTPLHLATLGKHPNVVYDLTWDSRVKLNLQCKLGFTALDLAEDYGDVPSFEQRLTWIALVYAGVPRTPRIPSSETGYDGKFFSQSFIMTEQGNLVAKNYPKQRKNKYEERINTLLIISTLVATVTFACGFTVPGGYNNSNPKLGMATLDHKCAFQVFVITNTIALYSSILAIVTLIWAHLDDLSLILLSLDFALPLLGTALAMMSVAFMAGLYVVLHDLFWLGIVVLVMGGVFLSGILLFIIPLYSTSWICVKYRILRYVFHLSFKLMLFACDKSKC